jgi:hypothetical protein
MNKEPKCLGIVASDFLPVSLGFINSEVLECAKELNQGQTWLFMSIIQATQEVEI